MENLFLKSGRIAFAIGILVFGLAHFPAADKFAELVPLPFALFWVYFTGVCLVAAGIAIIINKQIVLASLLLGIMLIAFVAMVHIPQALSTDEITKANGIAHALKTLSLAGAAFFLYGFYKDKV
ncbi:MAG: DoxX family protein [Leadbetterella sp.]